MWPRERSGSRLTVGAVTGAWSVFALACVTLMWTYRSDYTIPYHVIWASFALLYGLVVWPRRLSRIAFWGVAVATTAPILVAVYERRVSWSECSEIVLMTLLVWLLVWHVDRQRAVQQRVEALGTAEQAAARRRELTARFGSHEIRTRLTVAHGFAEMIRDATSDETVRSDTALVLEELEKASATATNLLTLVQVEAASPRQPVQLDDVLEAVVRRWSSTADRSWSATSAVGYVLADAKRVEASLDCLLENAVKFTGPGDVVAVGAKRETVAGTEQLAVWVQDSGVGIPEHEQQRVLEAFETGHDAGDRAGSGLGLAIVRTIVEQRGGTLRVESTPGIGTRFTMCVPSAPLAAAHLESEEAVATSPGPRRHALVPRPPLPSGEVRGGLSPRGTGRAGHRGPYEARCGAEDGLVVTGPHVRGPKSLHPPTGPD